MNTELGGELTYSLMIIVCNTMLHKSFYIVVCCSVA